MRREAKDFGWVVSQRAQEALKELEFRRTGGLIEQRALGLSGQEVEGQEMLRSPGRS